MNKEDAIELFRRNNCSGYNEYIIFVLYGEFDDVPDDIVEGMIRIDKMGKKNRENYTHVIQTGHDGLQILNKVFEEIDSDYRVFKGQIREVAEKYSEAQAKMN